MGDGQRQQDGPTALKRCRAVASASKRRAGGARSGRNLRQIRSG